ncbi:carbohydrate-binding protein [Faecalicoccus pleomorphus]|uniref:carbohydrate-binding protein n=1 Tax=Faecalicoccus pleomorphus TaxID=1323 RepID=UPI003DA64FD7
MKVIFNDLEEMAIQDWGFVDNRLNIKTLVDTNLLRTFFTDEKKTRKMTIVGDDEKETIINGYTEFYSLEEYTGKIYGVNMYKPAETPEAQAYVLNDMLKLAKMQAQALDDTSSLQVVNLYDDWQQDKDYKKGDKVRHFGDLYKCLQDHNALPNWSPNDAHSLWAKVLPGQNGEIGEWEQPNASNTYSKGDRVTHNGKTWESMVDKNGWEPGGAGVYETIWKEIKQ